jgi:VanZ family protein
MRPDLRLARYWRAAGWVLIAFVLTTCLLPAPEIEPVARILPDKVEHALAFFGLTAWFCGLYPRARWMAIAASFLALGVLIEVAQGTLTSTRSMDYRDAIADTVGIAVAWVLVRLGLSEWGVVAERLLPAPRR